MIEPHLKYLVCPYCKKELMISITDKVKHRIRLGSLNCSACARSYPITNFIPRFVARQKNYAESFGYEWSRHWQTQLDRYSGLPISRERFFRETGWDKQLNGQIILEAGSGAGRFTEHAASTGATVISFDYSSAVEANYRNNGNSQNVLIVQASIYEMPFREDYFDKVFCIGVMQHTPDPQKAFICLSKALKSGGKIAIDVYQKYKWWKQVTITRYYVRPLTKKIPFPELYSFCRLWVKFWWPFIGLSAKLTGRRFLNRFLLIPDYRDIHTFSDEMHREWATLDSFDMLSAAYDFPQSKGSVISWFKKAGLTEVDVNYGGSLVVGRGSKK